MGRYVWQMLMAVGLVWLGLALVVGVGRALPRGDQMLFSSTAGWRTGDWHIYLADVARGLSQRIVTARTSSLPALPVQWSPSGERIGYISSDERITSYLMNAQGGGQQRVAPDLNTDVFNLLWSPDEQQVAFLAGYTGYEDVYLAAADGTNVRNLTRTARGFKNMVWSPDGRYLAYETLHQNEDIFLFDLQTGKSVDLTRHPARDLRASWSPDSRQLAFLSARDTSRLGGTDFDLYVMNLACLDQPYTCIPRRLTDHTPASSSWAARWSPDGARLAFGSTAWSGGEDIYIVDVATGVIRNVTAGDDGSDGWPVWSPDGRALAYEARQNGRWMLKRVNADGDGRTALTDGAWDARRPVWSPDGKQIAFGGNRAGSWDIYVLDVAGEGKPRRLTDNRAIDFWPAWRPG
jgi:Tol biopolymer transport system component